MGLWGGIKDIGRRAGRWVGDEVSRVVQPIASATEGDWKGALSGIGRNVKRAGQGAALFGKDKLAGVDVGLLGAGGGAIEGGLGPSELSRDLLGETGSGGFAGALQGGAKGLGGVAGAQTLHNIGDRLGINKPLGALGDKIGNPFTAGPDYGPTRDEVNQQLMIRPDYEGLTPEEVADAEYLRGQRLQTRSGLYGGTPEMSEAGMRTIHGAGAADPESLHIRTAGTPLVPEGKQNWHFFGRGGPGQTPEQQAAIEQAQWRAGVPDQPDPIPMPGSSENPVSNIVPDPEVMERFPGRDIPPGALVDSNIKYGSTGLAGGFHTSLPETPSSERIPLSFETPQIPENVIDPRSYMTAPAAVGPDGLPDRPAAISAPPAPNFGTSILEETDMSPRGPYYTAPAKLNDRGRPIAQNIGNRLSGSDGPPADPNRPWWRQGLDYVSEHPDVLINAAGQAMMGGSADEYYRRMAAVNEANQRLRRDEFAYKTDPQRLLEQRALAYRSKWA